MPWHGSHYHCRSGRRWSPAPPCHRVKFACLSFRSRHRLWLSRPRQSVRIDERCQWQLRDYRKPQALIDPATFFRAHCGSSSNRRRRQKGQQTQRFNQTHRRPSRVATATRDSLPGDGRLVSSQAYNGLHQLQGWLRVMPPRPSFSHHVPASATASRFWPPRPRRGYLSATTVRASPPCSNSAGPKAAA